MVRPFPLLVGGVFAGLGLLLLLGGLGSLRAWLSLRGSAADAIGTVDPGHAEVAGTAHPTDRTVDLPKGEALAYEYEIEEYESRPDPDGHGRDRTWQTRDSGTVGVPFRVEDGTGEAVVDPAGATMLFERSDRRTFHGGDGSLDPEFAAFLNGEYGTPNEAFEFDLSKHRGDRLRLTLSRLDLGEDVYVAGEVVDAREADVRADGVGRVVTEPDGGLLGAVPFVLADSDEDEAERRLLKRGVGRVLIGVLLSVLGGVPVLIGLELVEAVLLPAAPGIVQ